MCFHFNSKDLAAEHLILNGWCQPYEGNSTWISKDGTCKAYILPTHVPNVVMVSVGVI